MDEKAGRRTNGDSSSWWCECTARCTLQCRAACSKSAAYCVQLLLMMLSGMPHLLPLTLTRAAPGVPMLLGLLLLGPLLPRLCRLPRCA